VTVHSFDLVQKVDIPAGHVVVTFHYRPPHLTVASVLSIGAVGVLLALLAGWLVVRRRREPPDAGSASASEREPEVVTV
jgi:LPXTG-motif cell wall-anchored protein